MVTGQTEERFLEDIEKLDTPCHSSELKHSKLTFMEGLSSVDVGDQDWVEPFGQNRAESQKDDSSVPAFYRSK
jgi:hypothetical protein